MEKTGFIKFAYEKADSNYTYNWKFEQNGSALKEWALLVGQDILESDNITFDTGILQKTKHSMKVYFIMSKGELIVKLRLGAPTLHGQFTHSKILDKNVSFTLHHTGHRGNFTRTTTEEREECSLKSIFDETDMTETIWRNQFSDYSGIYYNIISMHFTLEHIHWRNGTIKTENMENQLQLTPPHESTKWTTLNTEILYDSKQFTDFVICCGDSNFKVHKIVMAMRSPVFGAMFEQPLAETLEGKMTISDYEPQFIEEFLKFLYLGNADFETCASELFLLAEKYCVDHLKQLSENHLINSVNSDNVFNLYNLGKLVNSEKLAKKCLDTMKRNKKEMFKTANDAIAFLRDFPFAYEVVFE